MRQLAALMVRTTTAIGSPWSFPPLFSSAAVLALQSTRTNSSPVRNLSTHFHSPAYQKFLHFSTIAPRSQVKSNPKPPLQQDRIVVAPPTKSTTTSTASSTAAAATPPGQRQRRDRWTPAEKQVIQDSLTHPDGIHYALSKIHNRTYTVIKTHLGRAKRRLKTSKWSPWTSPEDKIIQQSLALPVKEGTLWAVARIPHRAQQEIKSRRRTLKQQGRPRPPLVAWTDQEDELILRGREQPNHIQFTLDLFASSPEFSHRTRAAISTRRSFLLRDQRKKYKDSLQWTSMEMRHLKYLYFQQGLKRPHELRVYFPTKRMEPLRSQILKIREESSAAVDGTDGTDADAVTDAASATMTVPKRTHSRKYEPLSLSFDEDENVSVVPLTSRAWTEAETARIHQAVDKLEKTNGSRPTPKQVLEELVFDEGWLRSRQHTLHHVKRIMQGDGTIRELYHRTSPSGRYWSPEEDNWVMNAVAEQIGPNIQPRLNYLGPSRVIRSMIKKITDKTDESNKSNTNGPIPGEQQSLPYLTPNSPELDRIDWKKVAAAVPGKVFTNCKVRFYECLSLRDKGHWTTEEKKRLNQALQDHGMDAWMISKQVGTRSPSQCRKKLYLIAVRNQPVN